MNNITIESSVMINRINEVANKINLEFDIRNVILKIIPRVWYNDRNTGLTRATIEAIYNYPHEVKVIEVYGSVVEVNLCDNIPTMFIYISWENSKLEIPKELNVRIITRIFN